MHSFSHQGLNTANNRELRTLIDHVRHGLDLFGPPGEVYDKVEDNKDIPPYIYEQYASKKRFKYLLDRDGEDAGFEDFSTVTQQDI